jgi:hypothetical protein
MGENKSALKLPTKASNFIVSGCGRTPHDHCPVFRVSGQAPIAMECGGLVMNSISGLVGPNCGEEDREKRGSRRG